MIGPRTEKISNRIIAALTTLGTGTPAQIVSTINSDGVAHHDTAVRQALVRMERSGRVIRSGYGVYTLPKDLGVFGLSTGEYFEQEIAAFLLNNGGEARTVEVFRALGGGVEGLTAYERLIMFKVLRQSKQFERRSSRGVWGLRQDQRRRVPETK